MPPIRPTPNSQILGRAVPTPAPAEASQAAGNYNTTLSTVFTKVGQVVPLYTADQSWARVVVTLETAGPVEVASVANFKPFLSGKAQTLQTGVPLTFDCARGSKLFIGASTVERVKLTVEPLPWLEQIAGGITNVVGGIRNLFSRK
jgi:hypothetical protein